MSSELSLFNGSGGLARRDARQVRRELSRLQADGRVGLARLEYGTSFQLARTHAVEEVAHAAVDAVGRVSLHAQQLAELMPFAGGRLQAVADALAIAEIGVIHDTARRLR